jgi:uncharacterized protein
LRLVLDTNVWLSAWLSREGRAAAAVRAALQLGVPCFSDATWQELQSRAHKPKFAPYWTPDELRDLLRDAAAAAHWVAPDAATLAIQACRDTDDDKFLHLALTAEAEWLVTGDADLLVLQAVGACSIVSPADFLIALAST